MMGTLKIPEVAHQKNFHMSFVRVPMLLIGIWPIKAGVIKRKLYDFYFWFVHTYMMLFVTHNVANALLTWSENYLVTASSMGIVIEFGSSAYKVFIFKWKTFQALIREVGEREKRIFGSKDLEQIEIYVKNAARNRKNVLIYTTMGTIGLSLYVSAPLINNHFIPLGINNETGVKNHYFIVYGWFPFDANKHYVTAYFLQLGGVICGYSYIVLCGAFYISMLSSATGYFKILQHIFINFPEYAARSTQQVDISTEKSQFLLLRDLIEEHLAIISFVQRMNNAMKFYMFLNFLTASFQLSLVTYQMLKGNPLERLAVCSFFITLSTQLYLTYNAAHDITVQNEKVAASILKGNWDTYPQNILKMLQLVCIRAQTPLEFDIGPVGKVKVNVLLQIFKALYSFISVIMTL